MNPFEILKGIDIFSSLSDRELERIKTVAREESFPEGTVIFNENAPGDKLYIIGEGHIDIKKRGEDGRSLVGLVRLGPGEIIGELSILDEKPRSASAFAAGPSKTVLLSIGKSDLDRILDQDQALAVKLLRGMLRKLSARLRLADEALAILAKMDMVLERVRRRNPPP